MGRYRVAHDYAANHNGRSFGPWSAGETVEVDDADVEWIQRDSPGVLTAERAAAPARDRQARAPRNRGGDDE